MNKKSRRNVLKGFAVSLPAAWTSPVVESVLLPAHAAASGCSAGEGCKEGKDTADGLFTVYWPGGSGKKEDVEYWKSQSDCDGKSDSSGPMAIAGSAGEAKELLGCDWVLELAELSGGCGIWECCSNCKDRE